MKKIMITFREGGENGGPYNSHMRIVNSQRLREKYKFIPLIIPKGRLGLINIKLTKFLINEIRENKPDIIHFTGLELIGFHVALASKLCGLKNTIVAIHGSTDESISYSKTFIKKRIIKFLEYLTLRWAGYSYGVSQYVSGWPKVIKYSNNYFGHIYNMVEENKRNNSPKNMSIREYLGISKDTLIAVSTGRIVTEKGYDILAKVIERDRNDNIVYLIIGDGDYLSEMKGKLEKEIGEGKVYFLGYRDDIASILPECDIFIIATLHETLCMSLVEAGNAGLAMIASNVGGIPEIIVDGYNGFLIEKGASLDFNKRMDYLVSDKELLIKLKQHAKEYASKKFNNLKIEKQLDSLYEEIK